MVKLCFHQLIYISTKSHYLVFLQLISSYKKWTSNSLYFLRIIRIKVFYKIWIIIYMYGITQSIFLKYQKQYVFCFCCTEEVSLSDVKGQDWKKYFQKQISHVCAGWLCAIIGLSLICPCKWCSLELHRAQPGSSYAVPTIPLLTLVPPVGFG